MGRQTERAELRGAHCATARSVVAGKRCASVYLRGEEGFEPTTLHWLRQPGEIAKTNAEAAVMREVETGISDSTTLQNTRSGRPSWGTLSGLPGRRLRWIQFAATHKPTAGTCGSAATRHRSSVNIRAWKRLINRDGRVFATAAYATEKTISISTRMR